MPLLYLVLVVTAIAVALFAAQRYIRNLAVKWILNMIVAVAVCVWVVRHSGLFQ